MKYRGNCIAAITALLCSTLFAWVSHRTSSPDTSSMVSTEVGGGEQLESVLDYSGNVVPCLSYQRIACASILSAEILPHLISVDRIILVPEFYRKTNPESFRTRLRDVDGEERISTISSFASVEALLAAKPDLVIVNSLSGGSSERIDRLREVGLNIFDLGPMLGVDSLLSDIRQLGQVVREAQRGAELAWRIEQRLNRVAQLVDENERKRAVYVGSMGGSLIGGTEGSSYHDLLKFAGLEDAAAGKGMNPWPSYTPEQLLTLDPDLIVTEHGHTNSLIGIPGISSIRAAASEGGIVELPKGADTVGLGILPAVEGLYEAVYGSSDFHP